MYAANNNYKSFLLKMNVSFPVYLMCFLSFIGYWIFTIYGGIGLTALPMDLIREFLNRPKFLSSKEAAEKKISLKARNNTMMVELT